MIPGVVYMITDTFEIKSETIDIRREYWKNFRQIRERVEFPNETCLHIATLYRIATHFHPAFNTFPYLVYGTAKHTLWFR
jgi:hypothetical protein